MADHELGVLDTSVVIDRPDDLAEMVERAVVSTVTVAELAFGLHTTDPIEAAHRERRYRELLTEFDPLPFSASAAHWYGALAAAIVRSGRNPRARVADLMLAAVAADLNAVLVTRNPDDFKGTGDLINVVTVPADPACCPER